MRNKRFIDFGTPDNVVTEDNLKNEKELYVVRQKMVNLLMDMRQLYATINSSGAEGVKQLLKEFDNPNNIEPDTKSINEYIEAGNSFIQQNKEMSKITNITLIKSCPCRNCFFVSCNKTVNNNNIMSCLDKLKGCV